MANRKISELDTVSTPTSDDLIVIVDNPSGDPTSKATTLGDVADFVLVQVPPAESDVAIYPLTAYNVEYTTVTATSGAITFDYSVGNAYSHTLTANITSITISNAPTDYGEIIIRFVQNNTGNFTVSGWPASVLWPGGTAPTITAAANSEDIVTLKWFGGTDWYGDYSQDYQ